MSIQLYDKTYADLSLDQFRLCKIQPLNTVSLLKIAIRCHGSFKYSGCQKNLTVTKYANRINID